MATFTVTKRKNNLTRDPPIKVGLFVHKKIGQAHKCLP